MPTCESIQLKSTAALTHSPTHPLTHSLTHSHTYLLTHLHTKKQKIDSRLYSWRQFCTFAHTNEFPTCFPHSHILSTKFPTFLGQLSTFFRHFSTCFPHFSGVFHILQTFTYLHIFIKSQTFVYTNDNFHIVITFVYTNEYFHKPKKAPKKPLKSPYFLMKSIKKGLLYKQLKSPKMCTKSIKLGFWQYRQKKSPFKSFLSNFILHSLM